MSSCFPPRGASTGAIKLALMIVLTLKEVAGGLELDETGERLYFSGKGAGLLAADCLRRRGHGGIVRAERTSRRHRAGRTGRGGFGIAGRAILGDPAQGPAPGAPVA